LGIHATHVGHVEDGCPARGSSDETIIEFAHKTNQVIVTSNHDMMLLCAEAGQQFVWLDPRGKHLGGVEQALLVLRQVREWEEILASDSIICVRARRTRCESIDPSEAARLAAQRMKSIQKRKRLKKSTPMGPLIEE
jgi:predicted nuclease of predicted toxin-antitoxin system